MEQGPSYTLREALPRCVWRRFQSATSRSDEDEMRIGGRNGGITGTHQPTAVGTKRRSRDGDQQQQAQGTEKKKRRLFADCDDDMLHTLPSFFTEYTADDMARFSQDMAHTDELLDEAAAELAEGVVPDLLPSWSPCLLELEEEEERRNEGGQRVPGRVPAATIKMLRAFTATRFHPISERFLRDPCFFSEDAAREIRESDRFISKVYAWVQERAAEAADEYDAKGYLECNADGTININFSAPSAPN